MQLARVRTPVPDTVAASPEALRGLPVLGADDNATNRRLLQAMLTGWGMAPTIVDGGLAALAELEQARARGAAFPVVLLDGHMPDLDGFAVAERIRQDPSLARVTVLLLTSDVEQGQLARSRELGIARSLVKPLTPSELFNAILLALGAAPRVAEPAHPEPRLQPTRPLTVLVAEDNRVNQQVIERLLGKLGHTVVLASNGGEALAALDRQTVDLVLMDVEMPEMDGFTATAAIRAREAARRRTRADRGADRPRDER